MKSEGGNLTTRGNNDPKARARCEGNLFNETDEETFGIKRSVLRLILLFKTIYFE